MGNNNGNGFFETLRKIVNTVVQTTKVVASALVGDIIGAVKALVKHPFFKWIIIFIIMINLSFVIFIASLPSLLWSWLTGAFNKEDAEEGISGYAQEINEFFIEEYDKILSEINVERTYYDKVKDAKVPPIDPYTLLAYYSATDENFFFKKENDSASLEDIEDININKLIKKLSEHSGEYYYYDKEEKEFDVVKEESTNLNDIDTSIIEDMETGTMPLNQEVMDFRDLVREHADLEGIGAFTDLLLAIMQQESGGRLNDVMQAAESGMIDVPKEEITPLDSIKGGVKYFKKCLDVANCSSLNDLSGMLVALQSYNFGTGYATWLTQNGYSGWTLENASEFSDMMLEKNADNPAYGSRYGDKNYIPNVLRYYLLEKPDKCYLYTVHDVTESDPDFFKKMFDLTAESNKYTEEELKEKFALIDVYEDMLAEYGNPESTITSHLTVSVLSDIEIAEYIAMAQKTDPSLSTARISVLNQGLGLVGKVGYFWGGKYDQRGYNSDWGKMRRVTASGSSTSGTQQPYGLDCSGFVSWTYINALNNNSLSGKNSKGQSDSGTKSTSRNDLRPGDLGYMPGHIGIYVGKDEKGNNLWVHSTGSIGVCVSTCGFTTFTRIVN